jgi:hypothetical protein
LRDAWYRIRELHTAKTNPCSEARLHMSFYFGCSGWEKHALDLAARGSYKILPSSEVSQVMIYLSGTYNEEERSFQIGKTWNSWKIFLLKNLD